MRLLLLLAVAVNAATANASGFAVYGEPRYPADFTHFDYARPDAPKGCSLRLSPPARSSSFDSLNPFILKGRADLGVYFYLYDTLMEPSLDEVDVVYPRLARAMEVDATETHVTFHLDPRARWHDGREVTAEDVAFTVDVLREHARPGWRAMLRLTSVTVIDQHTVRFTLPADQPRRVAVDIAGLRILPKHHWEKHAFDRTSLDPPLGSGPYRVGKVDVPRSVTYERVPDYWGRDLPSMRGRHNFDRIVNEYFFNATTQFEAFARDLFDFHVEGDAQRWHTAYNIPQVADGRIVKLDLPNWFLIGMNGFFFNLRQERFRDLRVRKALELVFDFEWINRNIFHGLYRRTGSYFENSSFAAKEAPGPDEIALMREHAALFPPEAFERPWRPTVSDGSGLDRAKTREALRLLAEAGYELRNGVMVNAATGEALTFTVLAQTQAQEKILSRYFGQLRRLGIRANLRVVDSVEYEYTLRTGNFDLAYRFIIQPPWPGTEQRRFWGSKDPSRDGANVSGLADPDVDALVERVIAAKTLPDLTLAARVLDRALQWGHYAIPGYHDSHRRVAFWNRFDRPAILPKYSWRIEYWWCRDAGTPGNGRP